MNLPTIALIKGLFFGITMAIIPGPIFFLIIQRTLRDGAFVGLLCGLGAVVADVIYALIAAVGLTIVAQYLLAYQSLIVLFGGLFLIYLGVTTYIKTVAPLTDHVIQKSGKFHAFFSTFLLTLTNPVSIISYSVIFAGLDIASSSFATIFALLFGVIAGALLVAIVLIIVSVYFRQKMSVRALSLINKIAGIALICFGSAAVVRGFMSLIF